MTTEAPLAFRPLYQQVKERLLNRLWEPWIANAVANADATLVEHGGCSGWADVLDPLLGRSGILAERALCLLHGIDFWDPHEVPLYPQGDIEERAGHFSRNPQSLHARALSPAVSWNIVGSSARATATYLLARYHCEKITTTTSMIVSQPWISVMSLPPESPNRLAYSNVWAFRHSLPQFFPRDRQATALLPRTSARYFAAAGAYSIREIDLYYEDCVIGGPDAFLVTVDSVDRIAEAIRRSSPWGSQDRRPGWFPPSLSRKDRRWPA